jgi:iron-sulfur cluster repair protein YtfE (RIC family)
MNIYDDKHAYLVQLQSEHRDVNKALRHITEVLDSLQCAPHEGSPVTQVADRLVALRKVLQYHFVLEDEGGCLDEAVARCPSLGKEVDAIKCEHPKLLQHLDSLIVQASQISRSLQGISSFRDRWQPFVLELSSHEDKEDQLLIKGLEGITSES